MFPSKQIMIKYSNTIILVCFKTYRALSNVPSYVCDIVGISTYISEGDQRKTLAGVYSGARRKKRQNNLPLN